MVFDFLAKIFGRRTFERPREAIPPIAIRKVLDWLRVYPKPPVAQIEAFFLSDPVLLGLIHEKVGRIIGRGIYLTKEPETPPELVGRLEQWFKLVDFDEFLHSMIFDVTLLGNHFSYLAPNKALNNIVRIYPLNPAKVDYQRVAGKIKTDEEGNPIGYTVDGKKIPHILIGHFELWSHPGSPFGYTPAQTALPLLTLRKLLSTALGKILAEQGAPLYLWRLGTPEEPPTSDEITDLKKKIEEGEPFITVEEEGQTTVVSALVYDGSRLEIQRLDPPRIQPVKDYLDEILEAIFFAYGTPLAATLRPPARREVEAERADYERAIEFYQRRYADMIREEIFGRLSVYWNIPFEQFPKVEFHKVAPQVKLAQARRIATLARAGLITRTPELENFLRRMEGLPEIEEEEQ